MSTIAGILHFDHKAPLAREAKIRFEKGLEHQSSDGEGFYEEVRLAMWYRAFHTLPESKYEEQPFCHHDFVLTWDGRLDNRADLLEKLGLKRSWDGVDGDLVMRLYARYGQDCLRFLLGDWALAVWDRRDRKLLLARDFMGVRRLFYRTKAGALSWCSTPEPLVTSSATSLTADVDYLIGCIVPRPPIERTSYREIRSIIPGGYLCCEADGKIRQGQYWHLDPNERIRYKHDEEYEEHFRQLLSTSIERRMRADRPVLAELSGGLDSSSIVSIADEISRQKSYPFVETFSYYNTSEPSGDERPYFQRIEQTRSKAGHHISQAEFDADTEQEALAPLPEGIFILSPGYFARSLRWAQRIDSLRRNLGCRVVLSGVGGDEFLGGVPFGAPEIADEILSLRWNRAWHSLLGWARQSRRPLFATGNEVADLIALCSVTGLTRRPIETVPTWIGKRPNSDDMSFASFCRWTSLSPSQAHMERLRYLLGTQLTCMDQLPGTLHEKRYPFLDESLYRFLAAIPRTQVIQVGKRRHLMRRALVGVVPKEILWRKTKWFGTRNYVVAVRDNPAIVNGLLSHNIVSDLLEIDPGYLRRVVSGALSGGAAEARLLTGIIGVEHWLLAHTKRREAWQPAAGGTHGILSRNTAHPQALA